MAIDPEKTWIDKINFLPPAKSAPIGVKNLTDEVDAATTGKAQLQGITGSVQFTFGKAIFYQQLLSITPVPQALPGVTKFVMAWVAAIQASVMLVPAGAIFGSPSPATIWSAPPVTVLDPPSLVVAQSTLQADLLKQGMNPVNSSGDSDFGPAFRRAFLKLTYTVTGLNSVTPDNGGPNPLIAPNLPLL